MIVLLIVVQATIFGQQIPSVSLVDLKGEKVNSQIFNQADGKPMVLAFWATWCIPCINELSAINDRLEEWREKAAFEVYAISTDDSRTGNRVMPVVDGKNWDFKVWLDKNQDLKRALNVANIPYTIIIKGGKIVYRHAGFVSGEEQELFNQIMANQ